MSILWTRIWSANHIEPNWFFRRRLLTANAESIKKLIETYEQEVAEIKKSALSMAWYMRGGASYQDIMNMSESERRAINDIIENNLEITKKSQLPFF